MYVYVQLYMYGCIIHLILQVTLIGMHMDGASIVYVWKLNQFNHGRHIH